MCRGVRPCRWTAGLLTVLNGGCLTGLTYEWQFGERNDLLTKSALALLICKLATVPCVPELAPTEAIALYPGF